jgi:hypothetical protein
MVVPKKPKKHEPQPIDKPVPPPSVPDDEPEPDDPPTYHVPTMDEILQRRRSEDEGGGQ